MNTQIVTTEQLARLYHARNDANKRMSQALRGKDKEAIVKVKREASDFNHAYDAALKQYKKQQKKQNREQWRTTMIRWYLDQAEQTESARPASQHNHSLLLLQHA